MKYGGFCVSTPYFFLLRFVSSFCGSLFVNLRFHGILGQMPVNGYENPYRSVTGLSPITALGVPAEEGDFRPSLGHSQTQDRVRRAGILVAGADPAGD